MKFSHPLVRRVIISGIVGIVFSLIISEGAYQTLRADTDRDPETIELVIPPGTAAQVATGATVPSIPEEMIFVEGDVLLVKNEDTTNHQLGPIWVPPGTTGRLVMEEVNNYAYGCSFQPSRYLGLDVRPRGAALSSRVLAIVFVAPPTIALIVVYSILVVPLRANVPATAATAVTATAADTTKKNIFRPPVQLSKRDPNLPEVIVGEEQKTVHSTNGKAHH